MGAYHAGFKETVAAGGPVLLLLAALSVYSIALIWERWRFHKAELGGLGRFLERMRESLKSGKLSDAVSLCRSRKGLASDVLMASLIGPTARDDRKRSAQRAAEQAAAELQRRVSILGTIAAVAPFIGLFGTVLGVMRAFRDLAGVAGAGPGVIAVGISEALVTTAAGLAVAIPAVASYNYFSNSTSSFLEEMGWLSDEIIDTLAEKAHR